MSEETKREEAEAKDEKNRPIEDAEAEKVVGGSSTWPPAPTGEPDTDQDVPSDMSADPLGSPREWDPDPPQS